MVRRSLPRLRGPVHRVGHTLGHRITPAGGGSFLFTNSVDALLPCTITCYVRNLELRVVTILRWRKNSLIYFLYYYCPTAHSPEGGAISVPTGNGSPRSGISSCQEIGWMKVLRVVLHPSSSFKLAWKTCQSSVPSGLLKKAL